MPDGRTDESLGAVSLVGLEGEALANSLMKAETKAKRRVALSICGLGMLDETEVEAIPSGSGGRESQTRRLGPREIFSLWEAKGHASRRALYDYVTAAFGKRVTALTEEELEAVRHWIDNETSPASTSEDASDAA
jgi:hypothetical protein